MEGQKPKADRSETVEILTENRVNEFYRLHRWTVMAARRFIKADVLKFEAREKYYELIESAKESL
jgi:hypothetical protein